MKLKKNLRTILGVVILVLAIIAALNGKSFFAGDSGVETTTKADTEHLTTEQPTTTQPTTTGSRIVEDGEYTTKADVAEYLYLYKHLPANFITKNEAGKLGWVSSEGNLWEVAPGKSIGGDTFGNFEGILPKKSGRKYYECDIDFEGKYRNSKRIVYSDDGLIFYTDDHYETFEQLYGESE